MAFLDFTGLIARFPEVRVEKVSWLVAKRPRSSQRQCVRVGKSFVACRKAPALFSQRHCVRVVKELD